MWGVMKAYGWDSVKVPGVDIMPPVDGPQHFIPVFDTYSQALKFTDGDETNIVKFEVDNQQSEQQIKSPRISNKTGPRLNAKTKARKRYVRK